MKTKSKKRPQEMPDSLFKSIKRKLSAIDRNFSSEVENDTNDIPFLKSDKSLLNGLKEVRKDGILHFRIDENQPLKKYSIEEMTELDNQLKYLIDIEFNKWTSAK